MTEESLNANQRHYRKNKDEISNARKERYKTDAAYREGQKLRRKEYLARLRAAQGKPDLEDVPEEYVATVADIIGSPALIGRSTLSTWINSGNLPEPAKFNNMYYFTAKQAEAMTAFLTKVAGHKRIFTSGKFDADIQAVSEVF